MPELQVYLDPCTINCRKVLAGLGMVGAQYKTHHVDFFKGEQKSESFTKINPMQTIPAAVDGDLTLTESNAILMYAAEQAKDDAAYPKDVKVRADANRWLLWEASVWFGTNYVYLIENVVKPELMGAQPDEKALESEAPKWKKAAGVLDARLAQTGKWILPGDKPSIVDISIASPMHLHKESKLPMDKYPNIARWIAEVEKLPEWQKTQGAVEKSLLPSKPKTVRADFNYTKDVGDKLTEIYFYEDPKSVDVHEPGDDPHTMTVQSGWGQHWDIDINGFTLKNWSPAFPGPWEDSTHVAENLYPEVTAFLQKELGASRVLVFDHTIRTQKNLPKPLTDQTNTSQRAPVRLVHCDYTHESAPLRVHQLLPDEADTLLLRHNRVAFINVWKPLTRVEEHPLAMCDVRSAPQEDFFKLYLRYKDRTGENYVMRHRETHEWIYFPLMEKEHTILLKTYDSDEGRARFVGHTAFEDPQTKSDAVVRESCEIRTICFF